MTAAVTLLIIWFCTWLPAVEVATRVPVVRLAREGERDRDEPPGVA